MYIPRTLAVEGRTYTEHDLLGLGSVFVVLAEPGAGKSDLLEFLAGLLQSTSIRAGIFKHRNGPDGAGLVIDAMDEVARTDPASVETIIAKAADYGRPTTVFAGRSSEWDQSRTLYVRDCFGAMPTIARLQPFEENEQRLLFESAFPGLVFDDFLLEARRMDLGSLLGNPQFLKLFGEAYIESGHRFTSKAGIFEDATRRLAHEANPRVSTIGRPPLASIMAIGDEIFAKLLLAGATGVTTVERLADPDYPFLTAVACADARLVVDTRLLKPSQGDDLHEPVHRIVAEYCAARYFVRRLNSTDDPLSLARLLSIIAPSGTVRTELRGLIGWLAALSGEDVQHTLAELDSYAVLANGDPARLTPRSKRLVLTGLTTLSANDPFFRRGDSWRRFNVGQFFTPDILAEVSATLDATATDSPLRDLMIELVASSDAGALFGPELETIAVTASLTRGTRKQAFSALVESDPARSLGLLAVLIREASSVSLDLVAHAVIVRGVAWAAPGLVADLLQAAAGLYPTRDAPRDRDGERRYFIKQLIAGLDLETVRLALDRLTTGLGCTCSPERPWRCTCRTGISKIVGSLLDRYFAIAIGPHEPDRVWGWLGHLHFVGGRSTDDGNSIAFLAGNDGLRRRLQWRAISGHPTQEATQNAVSNIFAGISHAGLRMQLSDWLEAAERSAFRGDRILWETLLATHDPYNTAQRASPLRAQQRAQALADPQLMTIRATRERSWRGRRDRDRRELRFRPGRHKRRDAKIADDNRAHFMSNRAAIAAGQFWWWTNRFANLYLIEPDELASMGYGSTPVEALRSCVPHLMPHLPSLGDLAAGKGRNIADVLYAHCLVLYRDGADLAAIHPAILTIAYTEVGSWPTFNDNPDEGKAFEAALEHAAFLARGSTRDFVSRYLEATLSSSGPMASKVDWLTSRPRFADYLPLLPLEWLERYPLMPIGPMEQLFEMAVRHGDRERLIALIETRFADPVHHSGNNTPADQEAAGRHRFWALRSFFFDTPSIEIAWSELATDPNVLLVIHDLIGWFGGQEDNHLPPLSPAAIYRILDTFVAAWPPVPLPSGYGTGSPPGEIAFRFLNDVIWKTRLAEPSARLPVLETLLDDKRFAPFRAQLLTLKAETLRDLALRDFTPPAIDQVVAMLDRSQVATVEDLRALIVEELDEMQVWLRGAETDPLDTFYTGDAHVDENTGRNRVVDRLERQMVALGLSVEIERHMAQGNRCDITVSATLPGSRRLLVIEVKGQWNTGLFTAAAAQLAERYSIHPDAAGQGIYLVFWYGPNVPIAGLTTTGIASPMALKEGILSEMPEPLRAMIDVVVLDVSRADAPPKTSKPPARRGRRPAA